MIRPLLLALALLVPAALAQRAPDAPSALDRYHEGAQAFVGGDVERAAAAVRAGLQIDPNNARLQALRDLIEQEQEDQQQGGGQNEDGQPPQGGGQPDDAGDGEPSGGEGGGPPAEEPEAEADQTRTAPPDPGDEPGDEDASGQRPGEGGATPPGSAAGPDQPMSRAQAARILDAVGGDERLLLREIRRAPTQGRRTDRDW